MDGQSSEEALAVPGEVGGWDWEGLQEGARKSHGCIQALEQSCWQGKTKGMAGPKSRLGGWLEHGAELGREGGREGEGQDLSRAQLGWAAHTRLSRARSEGAQGTAPVGLQHRGNAECSAGIDKALFERWKKKINESLENWLCHFWRTLTFSGQEGKNDLLWKAVLSRRVGFCQGHCLAGVKDPSSFPWGMGAGFGVSPSWETRRKQLHPGRQHFIHVLQSCPQDLAFRGVQVFLKA